MHRDCRKVVLRVEVAARVPVTAWGHKAPPASILWLRFRSFWLHGLSFENTPKRQPRHHGKCIHSLRLESLPMIHRQTPRLSGHKRWCSRCTQTAGNFLELSPARFAGLRRRLPAWKNCSPDQNRRNRESFRPGEASEAILCQEHRKLRGESQISQSQRHASRIASKPKSQNRYSTTPERPVLPGIHSQ